LKEQGRTIEDLKVGEKASARREITEELIQNFADVTGDFNPLHIDEEYAKDTVFKGRIAHGMLVASLFSNLIGTKLPGPGTVYISQTLNFRRPVRIGDIVTAEVEVMQVDKKKGRAILYTCCRNQEKDVVLDGEAVVSPRRQRDF